MTKQPKWRVEWDRLVGDHKFLAIKNWEKYQSFEGSSPAAWLKDYVEKDFDQADMPAFQRWLLDSLRRWRARRGSNIPAVVQTMYSATAAHPQDRHNIPTAVVQLVGRGFLIPTNEQLSPLEKSIEEKSIEKNKNLTPTESVSVSIQEEPTAASPEDPVQSQTQPQSSAAPVRQSPKRRDGKPADWDSYTTEQKTAWYNQLPVVSRGFVAPTPVKPTNPYEAWDTAIEGVAPEEVRRVRIYHLKDSDNTWWRDKATTLDFFRRNFKKMQEATPVNYKIRIHEVADPKCSECRGDGGYPIPQGDTPFYDWLVCKCVRIEEIA